MPKPVVILSHPQMGENIGFVARAMKNFGISDMRIINPRDGWPNIKAEETSRFGVDIINSAKVYNSFEGCTHGVHRVYSTTGQQRTLNQDVISPKEMAKEIANFDGISAILFGQESTGLQNEMISHTYKIVEISAEPNFNSLNLGMSASIVFYEVYSALQSNKSITHDAISDIADVQTVSKFYSMLEQKLDHHDFFSIPEKKEKAMNNIRSIFSKMNLTNAELQTLFGIFKV